jgi:hypothetical protein
MPTSHFASCQIGRSPQNPDGRILNSQFSPFHSQEGPAAVASSIDKFSILHSPFSIVATYAAARRDDARPRRLCQPFQASLAQRQKASSLDGTFCPTFGYNVSHWGTMSDMADRLAVVPALETPSVSEEVSIPSYQPLSSVWEGTDVELIEAMLKLYCTIPPEPILDSTYNRGRIWKGSTRQVVSMDIDPQHEPQLLRDNRDMHGVKDNSFGVVVFDPPHVGPQGRDKSVTRLPQ